MPSLASEIMKKGTETKETFNKKVKGEILADKTAKKCCRESLLYGLLISANRFENDEIRLITENKAIADLCCTSIASVFGDGFVDVETVGSDEKLEYRVNIEPHSVIGYYCPDFDDEEDGLVSSYRINKQVFLCDECAVAFIKGVFLSCGNVLDPEKSYHMELVVQHFNLSRDIHNLLKKLGYKSKYTRRGSYYIVYFKDSDVIVDLLAMLGALKCSFDYTDTKIERDIRNNVNRLQNCDIANMTRTVNTSSKQIEMIERLYAEGFSERLSDELKVTAEIRLANPDVSLGGLGKLHEPSVSKSCVNHRLLKIKEIYESLFEEE